MTGNQHLKKLVNVTCVFNLKQRKRIAGIILNMIPGYSGFQPIKTIFFNTKD